MKTNIFFLENFNSFGSLTLQKWIEFVLLQFLMQGVYSYLKAHCFEMVFHGEFVKRCYGLMEWLKHNKRRRKVGRNLAERSVEKKSCSAIVPNKMSNP